MQNEQYGPATNNVCKYANRFTFKTHNVWPVMSVSLPQTVAAPLYQINKLCLTKYRLNFNLPPICFLMLYKVTHNMRQFLELNQLQRASRTMLAIQKNHKDGAIAKEDILTNIHQQPFFIPEKCLNIYFICLICCSLYHYTQSVHLCLLLFSTLFTLDYSNNFAPTIYAGQQHYLIIYCVILKSRPFKMAFYGLYDVTD